MTALWYYSNHDQPIGPLTFAELQAAILLMSEPHKALVWHTGLDNWREAQYVPQLSMAVSNTVKKGETESRSTKRPRRAWSGVLTTIVVVAGLAAARNLFSPEPDSNSSIGGKAREAFIKEGHASCLRKQQGDTTNTSLSLSRESLSGYCSCYINALADLTTYGDVKNYPKDGSIPPNMKRKIEKAEPACLDKFQRQLMGDHR
jgi:hypothetical protein